MTKTAQEAALDLVARFPYAHVFRLRVEHNETSCDGGVASCKSLRFLDRSWSAASTNDPQTINSWDWSRANAYGVDCGKTGWVVVDEDPGSAWPFNGTRTHTTGRGRHHVYEDLLGVIGLGQGVAPWGVDIRGVGGFVIGPGSFHPHGEYAVLLDEEPAAAPPDLYAAMEKNEVEERVRGSELTPLDPLLALDRLDGVYARMASIAPETHQRNEMLNKMAFAAGGIWARLSEEDQGWGVLTEEYIKERLYESIQEDGDPAKSRGTIESGWRAGVERPMPDTDKREIEDAIFDASPVLRHIREAAHSAGRSAMGMLCGVLARVVAEVPPNYVLPGAQDGAVGRRASLNLAFAFTGISGAGKTDISELSEELLGVDQSEIQRAPSSGEGLIQSFLEWVPATKANVLIGDPRRLFNVDEIGSLGAVSARTGATIGSHLRSMLVGGHVGSENATTSVRRNLAKNSYRMALIAGVQPRLSGILLNDEDAGLPQRFVWVRVDDDRIPHPDDRPVWPGGLQWEPPLNDFEDSVVEYPAWLKEKIRLDDWEKSKTGDQRKSHRNLCGLKVAAALAFLHEQKVISDRWWEIAELILRMSDDVQMMCRAELTAGFREGHEVRGRAEGYAKMAMEELIAEEGLVKAVKAVLRTVTNAGEEGLSWAELTRKTVRHKENLEMALAELESGGRVVVEEMSRGRRIRLAGLEK